ncbi:MAG TPA: hypothetical protein GXX42_11855 [Petrimonas sp.]|uniref:hypothetical protein n=1 Tax=Petrimonas sp. TaxID=2023866 RepID=UPI00176E8AE7|nr:hypothetical protein [Petrimonas sp.]
MATNIPSVKGSPKLMAETPELSLCIALTGISAIRGYVFRLVLKNIPLIANYYKGE